MSAAPVPRGTRLRDVGAYTDEVLFFTEREREKVDGILRSDHRRRFVEARSAWRKEAGSELKDSIGSSKQLPQAISGTLIRGDGFLEN